MKYLRKLSLLSNFTLLVSSVEVFVICQNKSSVEVTVVQGEKPLAEKVLVVSKNGPCSQFSFVCYLWLLFTLQ